MEKVQAWLQENVGIILGVCVGVAVIEVWVPYPPALPMLCPPSCPFSADILGEGGCSPSASRGPAATWPDHCSSLGPSAT